MRGVHIGCRLNRFSCRLLWALFTSTEPLKGCSQTSVMAAVGLTLSLFLVFQDGSYLAEFLLEKGYEVSLRAGGIPRPARPPASSASSVRVFHGNSDKEAGAE